MKIKTIDIEGREWFDKVNGNSYFSGSVTLNYGMKSAKVFYFPFQYGYGDSYRHEAMRVLIKNKVIKADDMTPIHCYCSQNDIILRTNKVENCLKREVVAYGLNN